MSRSKIDRFAHGLTARRGKYFVEVLCVDCETQKPFWGKKGSYTDKASAFAEAAERTQAGKTCRVVDFDRNEVSR